MSDTTTTTREPTGTAEAILGAQHDVRRAVDRLVALTGADDAVLHALRSVDTDVLEATLAVSARLRDHEPVTA